MSALAPWLSRQCQGLLRQRGHAWLLHGPSGLGQFELGLALAQAWLCEHKAAPDALACGQCPSCHAVTVHTHADLAVLMPETQMLALGWPLSEAAQAEIDDKKRKPSKDIRIESLRELITFCQRTDGRGLGKAVLIYPAERMNNVTANALLKTLEEPVGSVRFVLATESADQLLPTLRSRCQGHSMVWPEPAEALDWLQAQALPAPEASALLPLAGGRPDDALRLAQEGRTQDWWQGLAQAMRQGQAGYWGDCSPAQAVQALQKLCHDLVLLRVGATPRFFSAQHLPACPATLPVLTDWFKRLKASARYAEHPLNAGLMLEALTADAQTTLASRA